LPLVYGPYLPESLVVAARRKVGDEMAQLSHGLGFHVVSVTSASADRIDQAYKQWGKGVHPAALNFGDCFAYEVAKEHGCALLYVGKEFVKTDIASVLDEPVSGATELLSCTHRFEEIEPLSGWHPSLM
jgi:ribonuclease VapC